MPRLFVALFLLILFSCTEISFKEPQPKGIRSLQGIPRELLGRYVVIEKSEEGSDTLIVTSNEFYVTSDSSKGVLSDSLVLKKYKGYYFINDNENPEWLLRIIKQESNGDLSYMLMEPAEKSFNEFLLMLNKEIKIDSGEVNGEKLYQIDPDPKQLISLIEKGYFKKTMTLKKVR